jgi:hypothetical protein
VRDRVGLVGVHGGSPGQDDNPARAQQRPHQMVKIRRATVGLSIDYGHLESRCEDPDGVERFLRDLGEVNAVLRAHGLPEHVEPAWLPPHEYRCALGSIAWSWLHCLRRLHALVLENGAQPDWRPDPAGEDYPDPRHLDPVIDAELSRSMRSHLIVHSDCEGWYVPVDFQYVLYAEPGGSLPGGILGSSQRLLGELCAIAPWLGVALGPTGGLDDAGAARLNETSQADPWYRERMAWFHAYEATRLSVELRTAVVFH